MRVRRQQMNKNAQYIPSLPNAPFSPRIGDALPLCSPCLRVRPFPQIVGRKRGPSSYLLQQPTPKNKGCRNANIILGIIQFNTSNKKKTTSKLVLSKEMVFSLFSYFPGNCCLQTGSRQTLHSGIHTPFYCFSGISPSMYLQRILMPFTFSPPCGIIRSA